MIVASVLYLVGALVTALTPDLVIMVVGRLVYGIGIGLVIYFLTYFMPIQFSMYLISDCQNNMLVSFPCPYIDNACCSNVHC